ncbi:MAG: enoyl-CoA hydratase [Gammaproteobacteria bacterium]|nr:enoyl-CoA hydratase [Gammaproteobacteria bacterium]
MAPLTDPTDHLIESVEDGVATLTMNRPEARNALSAAMSAGLEEAIPRLAGDPNVRVVVLTGTGGAFCAGGDVKGFARSSSARRSGSAPGVGTGRSFEQRVAGLRTATEIVRCLHEMAKPTLAAIPGPAAGGGLSLALACDIRIAAASAKFTTAFARLGLSGDYGGSFFLPRLVGAAKARELYFTAELIDAREAEQIGLVNHVYEDADFPSEVDAWKSRLAELPTTALGFMKKNLNAADSGSVGDVLDIEAEHMTRTFDTEDHHTAARAFVDKRQPRFRGR